MIFSFFSETEEEHVQHVQPVLRCLLENRLFVKAEKCEFHTSSVSFLSFIVKQVQLSPDPAKVQAVAQAVAEWPTPLTWKQLQQFLSFANFYHRFIQDFSKVAPPLTKLTSTLRPFAWTGEAEAAFTRLKVLFTTAPVLSHPDPVYHGGRHARHWGWCYGGFCVMFLSVFVVTS